MEPHQGAAHDHPVFVLLTHGEGTGMGLGHGLQAALGERVPQPQPFDPSGFLPPGDHPADDGAVSRYQSFWRRFSRLQVWPRNPVGIGRTPRGRRVGAGGGGSVAGAFVYHPAVPAVPATRHVLTVHLDRHPTNLEAAAIIGLPGYLGVERAADGSAHVRVERFGRSATALGDVLRAELRRLTGAEILD